MLDSPKQSKLVVEQIPLNDLYREGLSLLTSYGDPLLKQVQEYGHLQDTSFINLLKYPDILQFLLREHKHQWLEQDMPMDSSVWYQLRTICQLFCLVNSGGALLGTSLNAAIDVLFESVNKYKVLVQDSLVTVGNSLVGMREKVQNSFHPKIIQTILILLQNEKNLTKFSNVGIIVFDVECTFNLSGEMIGILESQVTNLIISLIKPPSNETYNYYHEVLLKAFDTSQCLLCESSILNYENFPWEKVSLLILYNLNESSTAFSLIKQMSQDNCKIHFLRASMETDIIDTSNNNNNNNNNIHNSSFIISSTSVSEEHGLLELIESNCNFFVVERDYHSLGLASYSPDLIVNESTCIILVNLSKLNSDVSIEEVFKKLHNIRVAYKVCFVLAYTRSTEEYMKGDTPKILAMLNNRISKLKDKYCTFKVKGSTETEGIASVISGIVDLHTRGTCEINEVDIEASEQEKWLVSLKCINSYSALALLSKYSLRELIQLELNQLESEYPGIPQQSLNLFHQICRQNCDHWRSTVGLAKNEKVDYANGGQEMLREAVYTNSMKNDLTDNLQGIAEQVIRDDITQLTNDTSHSKKNCRIMSSDTKEKSTEIMPRNALRYAHLTDTSSLYTSAKNNNEKTSSIDLGRTPSHIISQWVRKDKTGPKLLSEGLLAFQQQEGNPSQYNKYVIDGQENNSSTSANEFNGSTHQLFSAECYSTDIRRNVGMLQDNGRWLDETGRGGTNNWEHKELSCKQIPGVTQTKLIFK